MTEQYPKLVIPSTPHISAPLAHCLDPTGSTSADPQLLPDSDMEELAVGSRLEDARVQRSSSKSHRSQHPYLSGNYWPQMREMHLEPCHLVHGTIPEFLAYGQFVRNGPNSAIPPEPGANYHMFDGDGMVHGVYFQRDGEKGGQITPLYVNRFIRTDVFLASQFWGINLLPSIASMIDPLKGTVSILRSILRSGAIAFLSGSSRLSTANTALVYHDGRVLATCESGPPMQITAPSLDTVDWHLFRDDHGNGLSHVPGSSSEWITGHPKVDPVTKELIMFGYGIFQLRNPYIRLSIVDAQGRHKVFQQPIHLKPGSKPKMMHDFAITQTRAVILDLPLTMSPFNVVSGSPMLYFDSLLQSRFGIVRRDLAGSQMDETVQWFEHEACMIFHTVNAWDELDKESEEVVAVHLVACRFKGAKLVYAAGAVDIPVSEESSGPDVVHLFHYRFDLRSGQVTHAEPLSDFPIEYPSIDTRKLGLRNRFCYGASMREGSFDTALKAAKIDVLVKCDIQALIEDPPKDVDQTTSRTPPSSPHVKTIILPANHYASEMTFVPRVETNATAEDDGVILCHIYNEAYEDEVTHDAPDDRGSEVWIIDARTFSLPALAVIRLPQRVPYGLHGLWLSGEQIARQRDAWEVRESDGALIQRAGERMRAHTSTRMIASFWRWTGVWAGRRVTGTASGTGISNARFALAVILSLVIFFLLTYRLFFLVGGLILDRLIATSQV
ncbi:hypothetical protein PYCC9005_000930 [Savitreella phatthalungensis]